MIMKFTPVLVIAAYFAAIAPTQAEVRPHALFSDGAVLQQDIEVPVWGVANEGETVTVEFNGQTVSTTAKEGKWRVKLKPLKAGGPFKLTIKGENTVVVNDVLVGEVWVCSGQSNMDFNFKDSFNVNIEKEAANRRGIRMFSVTPKTFPWPVTEVVGKWSVCTPATIGNFSAVGYFFARDVHQATGAPVGMIRSSVGGTPAETWISLAAFERNPKFTTHANAARALIAAYPARKEKYPAEKAAYEARLARWKEASQAHEAALKEWSAQKKQAQAGGKEAGPKPVFTEPQPSAPASPNGAAGQPTVLYNAMIAPLMPYAIKGVIWYQGESNAGARRSYQRLFTALIADWRLQWGQGDFPFLFVQIAPHNAMPPELREAQFLTWKDTARTAMAVTTDVGEAEDIHPRKKEPVGARLALAARALGYGEKIEYSGPVFESLTVEGNRAILRFTHVGGGLVAKGDKLKGFTIAGADGNLVEAKAEISGDTVVVTSDAVPAPVAVRYGWANFPRVNLYNKEGLPSSPFRTDIDAVK